MIAPANLLDFSTSATSFQIQSVLYVQKLWSSRHRLGHTRMQTGKKRERTLNRIEHALSSRYDPFRPNLISLCLTNDFIFPRSPHLRTLSRIRVSTLVKEGEKSDRMLAADVQTTNNNSVLHRSTSSTACRAAVPSSLSEWSRRAEARSRHSLLRCWHCDCGQTKQNG